MARTNEHHTTDAHAQSREREETYQRQRDIIEALISGRATVDHWRQLPENIATALEADYVVELDSNGDFIIHDNDCDEQDIIQEYQDIEMADVPPLSPPRNLHTWTARHSRTRGICPIS